VYPKGGEVFKIGQVVNIKWKNNPSYTLYYPNNFPKKINIQVVSGGPKTCSSYTNNGSMGTCKGYVIYSGENSGSFNWSVPTQYPNVGDYMIRVYPGDIGQTESKNMINVEGFGTDDYSGLFKIVE
jgi:uncharacterized protein YodC (DUF2158 family)